MPLPSERSTSLTADTGGAAVITYGDYFTAVCDYLSQQHMAAPRAAAARLLGNPVSLERFTSIRIHLIKHGAFYHPALVTLKLDRICIPWALNVAVSTQGRKQLSVEVESLRKLNREFPEKWVPQIYHSGSGCAPGHPPIPMFSSQWFTGFHELHRCAADTPAQQQWQVWDSDHGPWRLDRAQVADFYRQALYILTCYFDPHTLNAILDWHHAAGDFIVQKNGPGLEVRLITVRRYARLFHLHAHEAIDLEFLMDAWAVFLMRTSLWMRLDRLDGVGELVWADDQTVAPMWQGFVQGIRRVAQRNAFPEAFIEAAMGYLAGHSAETWMDLGSEIIERFPAGLPEAVLMKRNLGRHAARLASLIRGRS
ncbi:MAG: hypothetical protein C4519_28010 [Desulfobacteraceae bacterium]|nr:MAG: hypothetical protein C4519_28010 [Desulfobacteraceae bacterium]